MKQHRRIVHKIPPYFCPMECDKCHFIALSVALINDHFREKHDTNLEKMCVYCGIGFDNSQNFYSHLEVKHGLPPPSEVAPQKTEPTKSAFEGTLKVYSIPGSGENDLLQFMMDVKPQIDKLVAENVNENAQKLQFIAKVELSKPTKGDETTLFLRKDRRCNQSIELVQVRTFF